MKYYKITDLTNGDFWYTSSALIGETTTHVAMSQHLDPTHTYAVEEVSARDFIHGSNLFGRTYDPDIDDDDDYYNDDGSDCYYGD